MTRFRLDHLVDSDLYADCGFDPFCGFFVEVFDVRRTRPHLIYDRMQANYDHERPLLGALKLIEAEGFVVCLDEALIALADDEDVDGLDSGVLRTIEVVMHFKRAAD